MSRLGNIVACSVAIFSLLFIVMSIPVRAVSTQDFYNQNDIIYWNKNGCGTIGGVTAVQLPGGNNVEKALNYLQSKGFTFEQATGIVGAMQAESGENLDPNALNPSGAYGIAQWLGGRKTNLQQYGGASYNTFETQMQFLGLELGLEEPRNGVNGGNEKGALDAVKATNTPEAAALAWESAFERSGGAALDARQANARKLYDQYKGSGVSGTAASSSVGSAIANCGASSGGKVNADGYAFPIALGKSEVSNGYSWPCPGICHHDGTAAFDLSKKAQDDSTRGTGVIAIYNGTIQRFNNAYSGIGGCQAFQLVGDDGWWYWYGHLEASSVQEGSKVTAGQQISTVGRRECTGNGSYPHLHIDRGSPKGHWGGEVCCRDPEFTSLINKLWEELGGGSPSAL